MMEKEFKGVKIPVIGYGTYQIKDPKIIKQAIQAGYRHIDTAISYDNEEQVGKAWRESGISREELFITTKIPPGQLSSSQVKEALNESLGKLKSDYVDLLLIHWPSDNGVPLEETLNAFEEARKEGKARNIGVSNFQPELFEKALDLADIICNQVEYHPYNVQESIKEICKSRDIALTAYTPIAKNKVADSDVINEIANKYSKTPAQVTLRWLIEQDQVIVIPRSSNPDHIKANIDIFDFELTEEERNNIFQGV